MQTESLRMIEEKRHFNRIPSQNGAAEIEIDHSYGQVNKSIYKIIEYSEFGLSFLVPFEDGYFLVGTPVKFTIAQPSIKFRRMFTGIVKYYHPVFMNDGKKYYKTGIAIATTYRDLQNKKLNLRPERHIPPETSTKVVRLTIDNSSYEYVLADYSKYSAAFICDESDVINFKVSSTIEVETISVDEISIFNGIATITRVYLDGQGKNRVVFQPRKTLINITAISCEKAIQTATSEIIEVIALQRQYENIDIKFKTAVTALRMFLENISKVLEEPKYQVPEAETETFLQQIFPDFFMLIDSQMTTIDDIVRELSLSNESHFIYKNYFQTNLSHLLLQSPVNQICYFKPNGYAGDYEMMRLTHANMFDGPSLFAKILSKYSTTSHLGEVCRKRTSYLENVLTDYLKKKQDEHINIFSIASGPALEIQELISHHPEITGNVTFTLLDQEIKALQYSMECIYDKKIKYDSNITINFIHDNLQNYMREIAQKDTKPMYDIIYSFGLFDYFDKTLGRYIISSIKPLLKPGGFILIANFSLEGNKNRVLLEYGFDWYLIYRDQMEMKELAKGHFPIDKIELDEIENGTMKFIKLSL
jgi:extracellular factor (EF) 3-hydroxypalmitic acid methyl ester biosynthesis protein